MISYKASICLKGSTDVIQENYLQSNELTVVVHADKYILQSLDLDQRKARSGISETIRAKHSIIENKDFQRLKLLQDKSLDKLLSEINSKGDTVELHRPKDHRNCSEVHETCCNMKITSTSVDWTCCSRKRLNPFTPPYGSISSLVQSNNSQKDISIQLSNEYVEDPCKEHLTQIPHPFLNKDFTISKEHNDIPIKSPIPKPRSLKMTKSHSFSPSSFHQRIDSYKPSVPLKKPVPAPRTKFFHDLNQDVQIQEVTTCPSNNTKSDQTKDPENFNEKQEICIVNQLSQNESNHKHELDNFATWRTPNKISSINNQQSVELFNQPCYSTVHQTVRKPKLSYYAHKIH